MASENARRGTTTGSIHVTERLVFIDPRLAEAVGGTIARCCRPDTRRFSRCVSGLPGGQTTFTLLGGVRQFAAAIRRCGSNWLALGTPAFAHVPREGCLRSRDVSELRL